MLPPPPIKTWRCCCKLGELAPRVLDAGIHVEAFRAPHQPPAENEETVEAAGILHGCLRPLEHPVGLGNPLFDVGEVRPVRAAPALGGGKLLLELHTANLLFAYALRGAWVGTPDEAGATESEHAEPWPAGWPYK